uniref:DNA-directed RNA polymerase n=1 Tax=viral metagenome TaxID=1070528 RepID=A0A6C0JT48_9ZZZZ
MMIPIRCFTCNKIIGNKWETYKTHLESGMSTSDAFAEIGLRRYCCKRMFLGHVEIIDKLLLYSQNKDNDSNEKSAK